MRWISLLLLLLPLAAPAARNEKTISLVVDDAPVAHVLQALAEMNHKNLVVAPDVSGTLSLHLQTVPWTQALRAVADSAGLSLQQQGTVIYAHTQAWQKANQAQREAEEAAYVKERNEAAQKKVAQAIETLKNGGRLVNFDVEIFKSRYHSSSYSIFNYLARQYGVKIPIKTQGWINSSLLDITVKDGKMSGGHMSGKNQSTVIYKYMNQLIEAVRKDA